MAIAAAAYPAIAAGINALGSGAQVYAQGKMNAATRRWNERMYGLQVDEAWRQWSAQNEYNSPAAQMQRLKSAGLNPNLVYENGATHTASSVPTSDIKSWNPETPNIAGIGRSAMEGLSAYQDYTLQQEQVKNMVAQRKNMELDAVLKTVQVASDQIKSAHSALDLQKAKDLYDTSIQEVQENVRRMRTGTDIAISQEVRNAALHAPTLAAALERVSSLSASNAISQQQLQNLKKTGMLQDLEIGMRKLGMSYSDPIILRMLAQYSDGKSLPEVVRGLWSQISDMLNGATPMKDYIKSQSHRQPIERRR